MHIQSQSWDYKMPRTKEAYTNMIEQIERAKAWHDSHQSRLVAVTIGDYIIVSQIPIYRNGIVVKTRKEVNNFEPKIGDACMLKREDEIDSLLACDDFYGTAPYLPLMMAAIDGVDYEALPHFSQLFNNALETTLAAAGAVQI